MTTLEQSWGWPELRIIRVINALLLNAHCGPGSGFAACNWFTSFNPQKNPMRKVVLRLAVLKIRKLKHREVKQFSQGHTANEGYLYPYYLTPEHKLLAILERCENESWAGTIQLGNGQFSTPSWRLPSPASSNSVDWDFFFPELQRPCSGPLPTLTPPMGERSAKPKAHTRPEAHFQSCFRYPGTRPRVDPSPGSVFPRLTKSQLCMPLGTRGQTAGEVPCICSRQGLQVHSSGRFLETACENQGLKR